MNLDCNFLSEILISQETWCANGQSEAHWYQHCEAGRLGIFGRSWSCKGREHYRTQKGQCTVSNGLIKLHVLLRTTKIITWQQTYYFVWLCAIKTTLCKCSAYFSKFSISIHVVTLRYYKMRKFRWDKFSLISPSKSFCSFNFHYSRSVLF